MAVECDHAWDRRHFYGVSYPVSVTGCGTESNVLCCLVVFLAVQVFTNNTGLTCLISHIVLLSLAGINYFVYLFRGNEFIFSDLKSIQTGLSVAGNYEFALDERAGYVILLSTLYIAFIRKLHVSFQKRIPMSIVCISLAVLCCAYIGKHTQGVVTETWEQKGSYRNGYILNFVLSIRDCFIAQPDGYSKEAVKELEDQYSKETDTVAGETEKKPTIIVVMSESYADLSVVGNFSTNIDLTPFYDSLEENTIKGHALSSVFGAKTPNSEWEFLTGNSMAFLPSGSVVYQQYITDTPTSLVSNLKNIGYTCVAMHPYWDLMKRILSMILTRRRYCVIILQIRNCMRRSSTVMRVRNPTRIYSL